MELLGWIEEASRGALGGGKGRIEMLELVGICWGKIEGQTEGGMAKDWITQFTGEWRGREDGGEERMLRSAMGEAGACIIRTGNCRGEGEGVVRGVMDELLKGDYWGGSRGESEFVRRLVDWGMEKGLDDVVYKAWCWGWKNEGAYVMSVGTKYFKGRGKGWWERTWGGVDWRGMGWERERGKVKRLFDLVKGWEQWEGGQGGEGEEEEELMVMG
ncbi:hypothetical protein TrCOL_g7531 [Triparma columacea]|uniref:Uncharacterized protein n=1 Tax=Triparma columacea TaxID=722753 RepID=A0A9W7GA37_9STRA|nr:hypothetical protein TrCOL_g7531 [Triparma columacea]